MYSHLKSEVDFLIATFSLLIFAIPALIISLLIKIDSKGPVLFKQTRFGKDKRPFTIYKFRTMSIMAPQNRPTAKLKNSAAYITRIGKFLRRGSIDEIPQLLNVLKGDMSLVGPRPVVMNETDLIHERDKYDANSLKPGITGWAQANGRDELDIHEKAKFDGEYKKLLSFKMDVLCLIKTIDTLLFDRGYREGSQQMRVAKR